MNKHVVLAFIIFFCNLLSACGGSTSTSNLTDNTSNAATTGFPSNLAVASPTDQSNIDSANFLASRTTNLARSASYTQAIDRIDTLLAGTTAIRDTFTPELFYSQDRDAECYGPKLFYQNHPDGTDGSPMGSDSYPSLPTGDLGIWTEVEGTTTEACLAAQLNARMQGVRDRSFIALMSVASMIRAYVDGGGSWPGDLTAGSTLDVVTQMNAIGIANTTFNTANINLNANGDVWLYNIELTYTRSATDYNIVIQLTHSTANSATAYEGLLTYRADDTFDPPGNCSNTDVTNNGSLHYIRISETELRMQSRGAQLCDHDANGLTATLSTVSTSSFTGNIVDPSSSWANNFHIFTADFNPNNLLGQYSYVWQAGAMDDNSRIMNVGLSTTTSGEGYFGYGDQVTSTDGSIKGFICNWAGPGNDHTLLEYAQRQHITIDTTTNVYEPTNSGASDITYAPTTACTYDSTDTAGFLYDRDLDNDLSDETTATVNVGSGETLVLDLMEPSGSEADIEAHISGRGFNLPTYPE